MSAFSSASTLDQLKAGYLDNCSYVEDGSPTKCAAFITCCTALLIKIPSSASQGNALAIEMDVDAIRRELGEAKQWLASNPLNTDQGGTRFSDFSGGFRL